MDVLLDESEIYCDYYNKNKEKISQLLEYYIEKGLKIALWGAGRKGTALLRIVDPLCEKISCVFDKNHERIGEKLGTGHTIEDYNQYASDVVLVANSLFELEIIHKLNEASNSAKVINIDNMILGNLSVDDVVFPKAYDKRGIRKNKICAVVVLYNPDEKVTGNIYSYAQELDRLYIYDNSDQKDKSYIENLEKIPNAEYLGQENNNGLAKAFNEAANMARVAGYTWMVTFDQDSFAENGMINAMREFCNSKNCDDKIAVIAPVINDIDKSKITQERYCTYFDKVIQSGAMHNLEIMEKVGGYDEKLFIDLVDYEYCTRCIVNGYKIVKLSNALLMHNQQDDKVKKIFVEGTEVFINKFSSDRYYYRLRNAKYCFDRYKESYPLYALDCQNTIMKLVPLQIKYDKNLEENEKAARQAVSDYEKGKYGKRER